MIKRPFSVFVFLLMLALPAHADDVHVTVDASGNWFNPAQSGHGLQIEVVDLSQAVVAWYTFDPDGNPLWLFGVGEIHGDTITAELRQFSGTGFPPDFDSEDIVGEDWGEVRFRQTGCDTATVAYEPVDERFVADQLELQRLTRMDGVSCPHTGGFGETVSWNLDHGPLGFEALFLDYPDGEEDFFALTSGHGPLPGEWSMRRGMMISGDNHSDDLMMVLMRPLDGFEPDTRYRVELEMQFATNVPSGCAGVGGSPGESVYMRLGASGERPGAEIVGGMRRANLDLGQQAGAGADALSAGNMANGLDDSWCTAANSPWRLKRVSTAGQALEVTADADGRIWVYGLSDSGFEATTTWYLTEFAVRHAVAESRINND